MADAWKRGKPFNENRHPYVSLPTSLVYERPDFLLDTASSCVGQTKLLRHNQPVKISKE